MRYKFLLILSMVALDACIAMAKGQPRNPASVTWSCCAGASGVCIQGTDVTCEKSSGDTICNTDDGQQGQATVEKSSPNTRRVTFQNSGKIYSACARPNND